MIENTKKAKWEKSIAGKCCKLQCDNKWRKNTNFLLIVPSLYWKKACTNTNMIWKSTKNNRIKYCWGKKAFVIGSEEKKSDYFSWFKVKCKANKLAWRAAKNRSIDSFYFASHAHSLQHFFSSLFCSNIQFPSQSSRRRHIFYIL